MLSSSMLEKRPRGRPRTFREKLKQRRATYIVQWREYRGLTQGKLAEMVGLTPGAISQLEGGRYDYRQGTLEKIAAALQCQPADLIGREPGSTEELWSLWNLASVQDRRRILNVAKAIILESAGAADETNPRG